MVLISFVLIYLAIKKQYEPLLLLPIAFGMLLVNICPEIMGMPVTHLETLQQIQDQKLDIKFFTDKAVFFVHPQTSGNLLTMLSLSL